MFKFKNTQIFEKKYDIKMFQQKKYLGFAKVLILKY
jgi:hypothetical protein